ncbi:MAG: YqgE/AlgH family protein [Phaeodactylibacter sp.]|uniref:YqgE/AlgH family protein n=1 Tax=Phaeodactylibacter sp. TaxID=1940289 RepID=UPI0032EE07DB
MVSNQVKNGQVLLAEPFMLDPNFKRAAILLCEHGEEGSVGFIMNKPLDMQIDALVESFPEFDSHVLYGGPVQRDTIHYLHTVGDLLEGSRPVGNGIYWGGDFEKLKFLVTSQLIEPKDIRFFVGYSGWSEGQLDDEMNLGSWVVADMHANYLFNMESGQIWENAMYNKGDAYTVIANMPEFVSWN